MKKGPHVTQNGTNGVDAAAKAAGVTAPDTIGGLPVSATQYRNPPLWK